MAHVIWFHWLPFECLDARVGWRAGVLRLTPLSKIQIAVVTTRTYIHTVELVSLYSERDLVLDAARERDRNWIEWSTHRPLTSLTSQLPVGAYRETAA